ncbi:hypothetical protein AAOE16_07055 [Ekhidna sp. MALMAid0563]|uniref:hypothetical protein n=1 Tax=Ekhidna sp. MALMAid0563 TaxID=3143937 RepID=UPI0032DE6F45
MKFEINVYIILVFLVPGTILLSAIGYLAIDQATLESILQGLVENGFDSVLILLTIILTTGTIVDSVRTVIVDSVLKRISNSKLPKDYLSKLDKDNLEVFKLLTDQSQVYYRLNSNTFVSIFIADILLAIKCFAVPIWINLTLLILTIVFAIATLGSKEVVNYVMNQFFKSNNK